MPFKPNDKRINKDGRPKGAKNKITVNLREKITDFLNDNFEKVLNDFEKLEPKDKMKFYLDFMNYAIPKYQSINITGDETKEHKIIFENVSKQFTIDKNGNTIELNTKEKN